MGGMNVARQLEQQLLNNRAAFPCGCVLACWTQYPFKDWVRTKCSKHACEEHSNWQFVEGDFSDGEFRSTLPNKFGEPFLVPQREGPLENKWFKPDWTQVTLAELEAAMEENLDRLDEEEEEAVQRAFRASRHVYHGIFQPYVGPDAEAQAWPKRVSRIDPHIVSQDGQYAISRFGSVYRIPSKINHIASVHDELLMEVARFRPGDLIDVRALQREHLYAKHFSFDSAYDLAAKSLAAEFYKKWPALAAIGKGIQTDEMLDVSGVRLHKYNERDAKLVQELYIDTEKGLEKESLNLLYGTLPLGTSLTDIRKAQEEGVEKEGKEGNPSKGQRK